MSEPYPLPSFAASIWWNGSGLSLSFPPAVGEARGSTIVIPASRLAIDPADASARGWHAILSVLQDRAHAGAKPIGHRGTPSQYEVERALAHDEKYKGLLAALSAETEAKAKAKAEAEAILAELGL